MNRRRFFLILAGAAIAPVAAKVANALPVVHYLWGDGIHDDAESLDALIRGEVVEFGPAIPDGAWGWVGDALYIPPAKYLFGHTVKFGREGKRLILGTSYMFRADNFDGPLFSIHNAGFELSPGSSWVGGRANDV